MSTFGPPPDHLSSVGVAASSGASTGGPLSAVPTARDDVRLRQLRYFGLQSHDGGLGSLLPILPPLTFYPFPHFSLSGSSRNVPVGVQLVWRFSRAEQLTRSCF